jgi:hypothetical protein
MSRVTTCNKCGKKLDMLDTQESFRFYSKGRLGYGTKYDGCELELDLCCKCMDELIDSCSISPIVDDRYFSEGGD